MTGQGDALLGAAQWVEGLLHSRLVVLVAILAVAAVGLQLLSGRIAIRRAAMVVIGCFLLFGASAIARGLIAAASEVGVATVPTDPAMMAPPPDFPPPPAAPSQVSDPYAGASIPG